MFKIIKEIRSKKIYHYLKENKEAKVVFIFEDENHYKVCNNLISLLKDKFKNMKIFIMFTDPSKPGIFINTIQRCDITKEKLGSRYDLVIIVPLVFEEYEANEQLFGLPVSIEKSKNEQDNIIEYYGLGKFVVFNLDESIQYSKFASIIDNLYFKNVHSVLIGDPTAMAEICNLTKTNPIAIFNNTYLVSRLVEKAEIVLNGIVDDVDQIVNLVYPEKDKLEIVDEN